MGMTIDDSGAWVDGYAYSIDESLAEWIAVLLAPWKDEPVYDFGCGPGAYLARLRERGFSRLTGFEAYPLPMVEVFMPDGRQYTPARVFENVVAQDIAKPFDVPEPGSCICLEVLEHVPEQYLDAAIDNVCNAVKPGGRLVMSWALRGQFGIGHCSCRDEHEVVPMFERRGMVYLPDKTWEARALPHDGHPWFKDTVGVYRKEG